MTSESPDELIVRMMAGTYAPEVYPQPTVEGDAGLELVVWALVADLDNDPLHVEMDFGDGSPNGTNDTGPAGAYDQAVIQLHTWNPPPLQGQGDYDVYYTVNITAYDPDNMSFTVSVPVTITVGQNYGPMVVVNRPSEKVDPADNVSIEVAASDVEGEPLTWTYVFNNTDLNDEFWTFVRRTDWTSPGLVVYNNVSYTFATPGNYTLAVFVSDALPGYQVFPHNASAKSLSMWSVPNSAPKLGTVSFTPSNTVIDAVSGFLQVNFSTDCLDADDDAMNITWDFGGGNILYNETSAGTHRSWFNQTWNYTEVGSFYVNVTLTDGRPGHVRSASIMVNVTGTNLPPLVSIDFAYTGGGDSAMPDEVITFTINCTDPDGDPIDLAIDFGDGSPVLYFNITDYVDGLFIFTVNHSYSALGQHILMLNYTDHRKGIGEHILSTQVLVDVGVPEIPIVSKWSWWDYTGLGLFAAIPVLAAARLLFVARRRKKADEEGVTLEEWYMLQEAMKDAEMAGKEKNP
jgi:hypothetical protein